MSGRDIIYIDGGGKSSISLGVYAYVRHGRQERNMKNARAAMTNNEAEYSAMLYAFENCKYHDVIEIRSDSELLVKQMQGKFKTKNEDLLLLQNFAYGLIDAFELDVVYKWIPREQNNAGIYLEQVKKNEKRKRSSGIIAD